MTVVFHADPCAYLAATQARVGYEPLEDDVELRFVGA